MILSNPGKQISQTETQIRIKKKKKHKHTKNTLFIETEWVGVKMFRLFFSEIIMRDRLSCPRYWDARSPPVYIRRTPANGGAGTVSGRSQGDQPGGSVGQWWLHLTSSHLLEKNYLGLASPASTGWAGRHILSWESEPGHQSLPSPSLPPCWGGGGGDNDIYCCILVVCCQLEEIS